MMLIGVCAGWLLDAGYLRFILICGTTMTSLGLFMLSLCTNYWQILLAQALCVGMGSGLLGLTCVAVIPLYFRERRMIATGIAATGSSLGELRTDSEVTMYASTGTDVLSSGNCVSHHGETPDCIHWLSLGCSGVRIHRYRKPPNLHCHHASSTQSQAAWCSLPPEALSRCSLCLILHRSVSFPKGLRLITVINTQSAFALMIGSVYIPFFYVDAYAIRLGVDQDTSFYILSAMNAASLLGRLAPNWLADKYGGMTVMLPCCLCSATVLFLFRFATDLPGLVAISIVYGFVSGGMVSLPPATIANLTDDLSEYGTRMGMGYTIASFGALIGNPIGGAAQRPQGNTAADVQREFQGTWIFAGGFMLAAFISMVISKYVRVGSVLRGKC